MVNSQWFKVSKEKCQFEFQQKRASYEKIKHTEHGMMINKRPRSSVYQHFLSSDNLID